MNLETVFEPSLALRVQTRRLVRLKSVTSAPCVGATQSTVSCPLGSGPEANEKNQSAFYHVGRAQQACARLLWTPEHPYAQLRPACGTGYALHERVYELSDLRSRPRELC